MRHPAFDHRPSPLDAAQLQQDISFKPDHDHSQFQRPIAPLSGLPSPGTTLSPTPSSRLAGEPAYCSGRHCCQWTVDGFVCNNHYPSAADLDRHVATEHAGKHPNGRPSGDYRCHWAGCGKSESFGNKPKLTRHLHSHTGHKPHPCLHPGCGKGFVTKEQLKNHETTHTKTKDHICPECGKGFAVKTALTSHMNVHRGAKPYVCDECGKGFADSSNLSKHKAIHKRVSAKRHRHAHAHAHAPAHHAHNHSHNHTHGHTHSHAHLPPLSACSSSALHTPSSLTTPTPFNYFDTPSHSIEPNPLDPCMRPCYDNQCASDNRVPCRSASPPCHTAPPCTDRSCSPDTFAPCGPCPDAFASSCHLDPACHIDPCNMQPCEPCEFSQCDFDGCDLQACMQDCMDDCMEFCHEHAFCNTCDDDDDASCLAADGGACAVAADDCGCEGGTPPLLDHAASSSSHAQSVQTTPNHGMLQGMDEEGFKQLQDFLQSGNFSGTGHRHEGIRFP